MKEGRKGLLVRLRPEKKRDPLHLIRKTVRELEVGVRRLELDRVISPDFLALIPGPPFRQIKLSFGHKVQNSLTLSPTLCVCGGGIVCCEVVVVCVVCELLV